MRIEDLTYISNREQRSLANNDLWSKEIERMCIEIIIYSRNSCAQKLIVTYDWKLIVAIATHLQHAYTTGTINYRIQKN